VKDLRLHVLPWIGQAFPAPLKDRLRRQILSYQEFHYLPHRKRKGAYAHPMSYSSGLQLLVEEQDHSGSRSENQSRMGPKAKPSP
jgi:hypothetical protein